MSPEEPSAPTGPPQPAQDTGTVQDVEGLLESLRRESANRKPWIQSGCLYPIGCSLILVSAVAGCAASFAESNLWILFGALFLSGSVTLALNRLSVSERQRQILHKLRLLDDLRVIGPLIDALRWPEPEMRTGIEFTLARLLPRLKASDRNLLSDLQILTLGRALRNWVPAWPMSSSSDTAAFVLSTLRTLEQIGGEESLPYVERLAKRRARSPWQRQIQDAARECLPALRHRLEVAGTTLVRPADSPAGAEALLRPAGSGERSDSDQLLRPSDSDDWS